MKDDLSSVDLTTLLAAKGGSASRKTTDTAPEELVFITEGLPPVPNKVVKSEKGDFVDLLPRNQALKSCPMLTWQKKVVLTENRHLKGQKKSIKDISSWIEAFLTFTAIRNRKLPEHTNDLLAYGALIARGARDYKGCGWASYDYQFRRLAAARGKLGNWGQKDVSLWNETVYKPTQDQELQKPTQSSEGRSEDRGSK